MRLRKISGLARIQSEGEVAPGAVATLLPQPVTVEPEAEASAQPEDRAATRARARRTSLALEGLGAYAIGLLVIGVLDGGMLVGGGLLAVWLVSAYHAGSTLLSPARAQIRAVGRSAVLTMATVSAAVAVGIVGPGEVAVLILGVLAATTSAVGVRLYRRRSRGAIRTLLVGDRVAVTELASRWLVDRRVQVVSVCVVEPDLEPDEFPTEVLGAPALDDVEDIPAAASRLGVDSVVVCPSPGFTATDMRRLAWSLESTPTAVGVVGVLDGASPHRVMAGRLAGSLVMDVSPPRAPSSVRLAKSAVDRILGALLLALISPLLAVLCVAVRLDSRGPGFFVQHRVGLGGREFKMYKLRTMRTDAEAVRQALLASNEADGVLFKMQRDPRITRVGRLLRRTSLDELPQLINVAWGQMSLIGPRPALPEEVARYDVDVRRRLAVKPGLTGLWQVSGRSDLSWDQSVALDLEYVDNWRLSDDVAIALRTVDAVVRSRGAY